MDPKRLDDARESARRGRLLGALNADEIWEFAWELVNEHNQLAAQHGAKDARRAMKQEILALARAVVPIPEAAREIVLHAQAEGLILVEVRPGDVSPRPRGRASKRSDN